MWLIAHQDRVEGMIGAAISCRVLAAVPVEDMNSLWSCRGNPSCDNVGQKHRGDNVTVVASNWRMLNCIYDYCIPSCFLNILEFW
jgi:hypothetical protein